MRCLILLPALAGCASVGDLQQSAVDETYQSTKTVAQVSQCLSIKLAAAPIKDADGNTLFIVKNAYQAPLATITLEDIDGSALVSLRRSNSLGITGIWKECAV